MNLAGKIHVLYRCRMCPSLYSNVEQALSCCQNVTTVITGQLSSKEEEKKLKDDVNKSKEDINKSKEDINKSKEDINKSKEDINKSKEDENKSKEDENMSKEDENMSKEDENMSKEDENKLKANVNKSNNDVSKLKTDENKSKADENNSHNDVNKSKEEGKKLKVEKKLREGERTMVLKLDTSLQEDETSTESAEESTPEEDEEEAARQDREKDDGVPILKELTIQGGSSVHHNKSGRGGYRVPIWKRKDVDMLIQMLKENYWRFDHGDDKDKVWREITAEISKSNPSITLKQVINKWYGIKRRFREYYFNQQTLKCPRWYETVGSFCKVEPGMTKKTNDDDLNMMPSLDFEANIPRLMETDSRDPDTQSRAPDTQSQTPDPPERKKQTTLQNILDLDNKTSYPGERHKLISSLFKRKQNESSGKQKQGIKLSPEVPPRKRRRTSRTVSQTNQLLKQILEETRRHNLEVETHNTHLRRMFAGVVAAMNQKNVLLKEVVDQNSSGA